MTLQQSILLAILAATAAMFVWARWRHDMVAVGALLACVVAGLVPAENAFEGFGHPAVVTVAGVLVLSRALQTSGAVDALAQFVLPRNVGPGMAIAAITTLAATLSAFMNNVGALALLMPVALQLAARRDIPPGQVLMPLAFGSVLGGMTTLIGTPPNLIVSEFRAEAKSESFAMFDFTPVGAPVAVAGVACVVLLARILVPSRAHSGAGTFRTEVYMTEARVPEASRAVGMTLGDIEKTLVEADAFVVGLIRHEVRLAGLNPRQRVEAGDILVVEADPDVLGPALTTLGLVLEEDKRREAAGTTVSPVGSPNASAAAADDPAEAQGDAQDDLVLSEYVVMPASPLVGRSAADIRLRTRFGINMLAISRQGSRTRARLRTVPIQAGDVLLMQGLPERLAGFAAQFGCVPLAERPVRLPNRREIVLAVSIMAAAIAAATFGLVPAAIAFTAGVLAAMAMGVMPPRTVYTAIDWPVIVLLAALMPVADAMATTGAADLIARLLFEKLAQGNAIAALALLLIVTMTLSDVMNNAAIAAVMCPIAIGTAQALDVNVDPFLMAVAVGASCAFLTPIGHQNNTLILGPGGFRFGDYWRLGLPVEVIVICVAVPMILFVWPLR